MNTTTISIQSDLYQTPGIVAACVWEHSGPEDWIEVKTPGGRIDEFQKKFWKVDPT